MYDKLKKLVITSFVLSAVFVVIYVCFALSLKPEELYEMTVSDFSVGITEADSYTNDSSLGELSSAKALSQTKEYMLVLHFTVTTQEENTADDLFSVKITFGSIDVLDGRCEEVNSGTMHEMVFTNGENGNLSRSTTVSFSVPQGKDVVKEVRMLMRLKPMRVGFSTVSFGFESRDVYFAGDCGGFTQSVHVV